MERLKKKFFETEFENKKLSLETSDLGQQANACVLGRWGETAVLVTVVMGKTDQPGNFLPLMVNYEERFYAAGKIIGSRFIRRESRPSDEAVLSGRLIDRVIRPLFDSRLRRSIQVVATVLAYDGENDPDFISLLATSLALSISDIPWNGPIAGVRIQKEQPKMEAFFAGTEKAINMIEFSGEEAVPKDLIKIFEESQTKIKKIIDWQKQIIKKLETPKADVQFAEAPEEIKQKILGFLKDKLEKAIFSSKQPKEHPLASLKRELLDYLSSLEIDENQLFLVDDIFEEEIDRLLRKAILEKEQRPDGRKLDEIRPLHAEVSLFKRTHGSALFIRGSTQALSITTLAAPEAEQLVETMETSEKKRFLHHYNFPSYSVGEIGPFRSPGRREIGHGKLAEKALSWIIPPREKFPYTIRVVSEILSSNGSSSMASVCASSLSLMDAGVPIKKPVAGIAMGLVGHKILTDIQGPEDHHGDMDFKMAGTEDGITAIQMDVKIEGINKEIFEKAINQARKALQEILDLVKKVLPKTRPEISPYAPTIFSLKIKPEKIGGVIGSGGKTIQGIIQTSGEGTNIDVEPDGQIFVSAPSKEMANKALEQIKAIVKEYKIGEIVEGEITKIFDFGALLGFGSNRDGLIHISELKDSYVKKVEEVVKIGDKLKAKVIKVDPGGKISLSLKNLK